VSIEQQGAGTNDPLISDGTARVRATSATTRAGLPLEPPDSAFITAELPAVTARPPRYGQVSRYADPDRKRGGMIKREPAPVALRVIVWFLFFVFLVALAGVLVEDLHPDWLAFIRNDVHTVVKTPPKPKAPKVTAPTTRISIASTTPGVVNYSVPASTFSIEIVTIEACWTTVHAPIGAPKFLLAETIPAATTKVITVSTSAQVITSNSVRAIRIMSDSKRLGAVASPKGLVKYTFTPSGT
jgi:hypothetical protein